MASESLPMRRDVRDVTNDDGAISIAWGVPSHEHVPSRWRRSPNGPGVEISEGDAVIRGRRAGNWLTSEIIEIGRLAPAELRYYGPYHLLVLYGGIRRDGFTVVEGVGKSTLRNLSGRLTF